MSDIASQTVRTYLGDLAARRSTPGGGAAAAIIAAESAALIQMVAEFSKTDRAVEIVQSVNAMINRFTELADADTEAFRHVMEAYKTGEGLPAALTAAASVPAEVSRECAVLYPAIEYLAEHGNQNLISDIGIAAAMLKSVLTACEMNIRINLKELEDPDAGLVDALANIPDLQSKLHSVSRQILDRLS